MDQYTHKLSSAKLSAVLRKVNLLLSDYLVELYRYNSSIKDTSYYLKPVHVVIKGGGSGERVKYIYYGRYWYRMLRERGSIKWVYAGREKPDEKLPDPPRNPLEGLAIKVTSDELTIISSSREIYELINSVLASS